MYGFFNCFNGINLFNYRTKYHIINIISPIKKLIYLFRIIVRDPGGLKLFTVKYTKTIY